MATMIDLAKSLRGGRAARKVAAAASGNANSVRYGTATAVGDGTATVLLDGSTEAVTLRTEAAVSQGERVRVVSQGGSYVVVALGVIASDAASARESASASASSAAQAAAQAEAARRQAEALREEAARAADGAAEAAKSAEEAGQQAVTAAAVEYAVASSATEAPESGWSSERPERKAGEYTWMRTKFTAGNGVSTYSEPALVTGDDGVGIASQEVAYAAGDSGTEPPGEGWQASPPARSRGQWLWARTTTALTDGSELVSYDVTRDGLDAPSVELACTAGSVFRNSRGTTTVRAVVLCGEERVTDLAGLLRVFGAGAALRWASVSADGSQAALDPSDPRLGDDGFTLRVDAADVEASATFTCALEY